MIVIHSSEKQLRKNNNNQFFSDPNTKFPLLYSDYRELKIRATSCFLLVLFLPNQNFLIIFTFRTLEVVLELRSLTRNWKLWGKAPTPLSTKECPGMFPSSLL